MSIVPEMRDYSYKLEGLGPCSVQKQRLRALIETFKIMRTMNSIDCRSLVPLVDELKRRGHRFKIKGKRIMSVLVEIFFHAALESGMNYLQMC